MPDDADRTEEIRAREQKPSDYLDRVLSGKIQVFGNGPEPQNTTRITYMDHTSSRRR